MSTTEAEIIKSQTEYFNSERREDDKIHLLRNLESLLSNYQSPLERALILKNKLTFRRALEEIEQAPSIIKSMFLNIIDLNEFKNLLQSAPSTKVNEFYNSLSNDIKLLPKMHPCRNNILDRVKLINSVDFIN